MRAVDVIKFVIWRVYWVILVSFGVIDSLLDKETYIYILTDVAISSMKLQFTFVSPTIDNDVCLYQAMMYIT